MVQHVPTLHRECYRTLWWWRIARISRFCRAAEGYFQRLAGPINVSVDLKYDVLRLWVFVYGIPAWVGRSNYWSTTVLIDYIETKNLNIIIIIINYWWWRTLRIYGLDLKYDVLCLWVFVYGIPVWVRRINGFNFVLVGGTACANHT